MVLNAVEAEFRYLSYYSLCTCLKKKSSIFWDAVCSDLPWPKTIGMTHATVDSRYLGPILCVYIEAFGLVASFLEPLPSIFIGDYKPYTRIATNTVQAQ